MRFLCISRQSYPLHRFPFVGKSDTISVVNESVTPALVTNPIKGRIPFQEELCHLHLVARIYGNGHEVTAHRYGLRFQPRKIVGKDGADFDCESVVFVHSVVLLLGILGLPLDFFYKGTNNF